MSSKGKTIVILLLVCVVIAILPLAMVKNSEFGGADGEASDAITSILGVEEYEPWASPLYEPPGGETESLLFCLQAALGAGVIGYSIGILKERNKRKTNALNG